MTSVPPAPGDVRPHRFLVPGLVFMGMVVAVVSSLGAPLIPTVAATDGISLATAQWALTISFLVAAVATPLSGRLGDGPRRREVILALLGAVTAGSVLAALPLGFPALLVGRALQGVGLGLTPLGIAVARDVLPPHRSAPAAAVLSVTTVAGVGLGYPVTGLVAQLGGLHAAFWFGAAVSAIGFVVAAIVVPSAGHRTRRRVDLPGAALLGAGLVGLLLGLSQGETWGWTSPSLLGLLACSVAVLAVWVVVELRAPLPLIDLRLLRRSSVLMANATSLLAGVGMYLLISLVTRYVQTPTSSGYGLGASVAIAGLALLPFSAASVAATRLTRALGDRVTPVVNLVVGSLVVLAALLMFSYARTTMTEVLVVMAISGFGVGGIFAVMPGLIIGSVPSRETGSATSFNQVIRYVGYAAGSTLAAVVLEAHTAPGHALPASGGYTSGGLVGCAMWIATVAVTLVLSRLRVGTGAATGAGAGAGERQRVADEPGSPGQDAPEDTARSRTGTKG